MRAIWLAITTCLLSCVLAAGGQVPGDWPHVRGPMYEGHVDGTYVALPWTNGQPGLLWEINVGEGYSGMSVADGRIYTQAQRRDGQYVVCLDVNTGHLLWQTRYNYPWQLAADLPGPYATPTCCGGRIYYTDCYGFAGCLDAGNGKTLWSLSLTEKFGGKGTGFGYACSPLVDDGRVFLPVGGKGASVVAVSASDGALLWRAGNDAASYVPCLPILVEGHRQIVTLLQNVLVAHDPVTGAELWRYRLSVDGYDEHSCLPLYQEPLLFCESPFRRGARVLKLSYEGTTPKAEEVWRNRTLSADVFSPVLADGCVYGSDVQQAQANPQGGTKSQFKCIELATGRELWASDAPGHASVLVCGDKLLLLNESGFLIVAEASRTGYSELARTRLMNGTKPCWTAPTVYDGRLLVRNQEMLACYQVGASPHGVVMSPTSLSGADATTRIGPTGLFGAFLSWLDRHQSSAQWDPSLRELSLWYESGLGVLAISGVGAWFLRRRTKALPTLLAISAGLGIVALPLISFLAGRLIFTWPVACHSIFLIALATEHRSTIADRLKSRARLLSLVIFCVGYYFACQRLFVPSGIGFLCGFAPALPAAISLKRMDLKLSSGAGATAVALCVLSFSLYFWSSALFIRWRMSK